MFLLEIFYIVVISKSFRSYKIDVFLSGSEFANQMVSIVRIFYCENGIGCEATHEGDGEERV